MKFDVVIGNPPYQEANDSGNALWPKFVEKSMNDLVVNGGKLCFVTPASWIGKKSKGGKVNYSSFVNNKMDHLVMFDSKKKDEYFPGVGTTLCWYIIEKSPAIGKTRVVQYTNGQRHAHEIMIEEGKEYPAMFTSEAMSIHRKLTEHTPMNFSQTRELHYYTMKKKGTVNETQNRKFPYKSYFSHNITRYASYQMKDYTSWKTMVPQTATAKDSFVDKECNVSEDLLYVKCKTKKEALNCRNVLCSTLYRYISAAYRKGRNMSGFTIFPNVDLTRTWTDKELYKHFKLTKEEIAYIEATVK